MVWLIETAQFCKEFFLLRAKSRLGAMNPLLWIFQLTVVCHDRHLRRVFTINHSAYRLSINCGGDFE